MSVTKMIMHSLRKLLLGTGTALLTIATGQAALAQSGTPTVSIGNASVTEGNSGTRPLNFPVTRSGATTETIAVEYQTNASPTNAATAGTDYVSISSGNAVIPAGASTLNLPVSIIGDAAQEPDENFFLHLLSAHNAGPALALGSATDFPALASGQSVLLVDLNGDGVADLVTAHSLTNQNNVQVRLGLTAPGDTAPSFGPATNLATAETPTEVRAGDLNGDGRPDLVVASGNNLISVFLSSTAAGDSTVSFAPRSDLFLGGNPAGLTLADVNNDGLVDFIVGRTEPSTAIDSVRVAFNATGPGATTVSLGGSVEVPVGNSPRSITASDLNGDGLVDLAVSNVESANLSVLANTTEAGAAAPSFAVALTLATGSFPRDAAVADINGDGRPDIAVASQNGNSISLFVNNGAPGAAISFAAEPALTATAPRGLLLEDFNGDGRPDLAYTQSGSAASANLRLNTTAPGATRLSFAPAVTSATGNVAPDLAAADINGDGLPDLAVVNQNSSNVSVLLNTTVPAAPPPSFASAVAQAGTSLIDAQLGDLNGDGRLDLLGVDSSTGTLVARINTTAPGASTHSFAPETTTPAGNNINSLRLADFNGDGRLDVAISGSALVRVSLNTTAPGAISASFSAFVDLTSGPGLGRMDTADLNGDGRVDIVVTNGNLSDASIFRNSTPPGATTASFAVEQRVTVGANPRGVALQDLNGDGRPDLVVANLNGGNVSLLINTTAPGATTFSFGANAPLNVSRAFRVALADLDGDGRPDLAASISNAATSGVSLFRNTTSPGAASASFSAGPSLSAGQALHDVQLLDVNGDGRDDLIYSAALGGGLLIARNMTPPGGSLALASPAVFSCGGGICDEFAGGDLNGDGRLDFVTTRDGSEPSTLSNTLYPAALGTNEGTGTIVDDDAPPTISINDVTRAEGNNGNTAFAFTVSLSKPAPGPVSVAYTTANGTATEGAGADYLLNAGAVNFSTGQSSQTITVQVVGDAVPEADETFFVNLSNPNGATIADAQGLGTITNDDIEDVTPDPLAITNASDVAVNVLQTSNPFVVTGINVASPYLVTGGFARINNGPCLSTSGTVVNGDTVRLCHVSAATFATATTTTLTIGATGVLAGVSGTYTSTTEAAPTFSVASASRTVPEGDSGTTPVLISVGRVGSVKSTVTLDFTITDGTATIADGDYQASSGTLTFASGVSNLNITVNVTGDQRVEPDETLVVTISNPSPIAPISASTTTLTITNDDAAALSINDVSVAEGNSGNTAFTFDVSLSTPSASPVTVNFATANGTAVSGSDYTAASGTLTFAAGETEKTVTVQVTGDTLVEANETFFVNLAGASGATIADAQGTGTITNDDAASLSINDVNLAEGNSGNTAFTFDVSLSTPSASPVTVNFTTANGTAVSGSDYAASSGTLTFAAGETEKTVTVQVTGDTLVEANETFFVNLASATGATIADAQGIGTITNDDAASLSINDVSLAEGNSGNTAFTFDVSLSTPSASPVTVNFATANGTAVSGSDYTAASGTLTFAAGETEKTVTVQVTGDTLVEANETFFVNLASATGATIADAQGIGTITNDDAASLSINDVNLAEGNSGNTAFTFDVSLSTPSASPVTVNFATANGTAVSGSDYAAASGTLTFAAGETEKTVTVQVTGDTLVEANETFFVNLSGAGGVTIADAQGVGTITNDDAAALSINDLSRAEGNSGNTAFTFDVSLSTPSASPVTVNFATANGTAVSGSDYTAASGTLTFAAGETEKTVTVQVTGDTLVEANETFFVNLASATGATIADAQGIGTITNDDAAALSINDVSLAEGNSGNTAFTFDVSLSTPSASPVTVNFATANGTAVSGSDYTAASGTLTFAAGETEKTVTVQVTGDTLVEANETFFVNLASATGATIADAQGIGTITNDDAAALSINDVSLAEGNSGNTAFTFDVSLSTPSASPVTVNFATANGTAVSGSDYTAASGTLTFAAGETEKTVTVQVTGDTLVEANETFFVNLAGTSGATIDDAQGTGTITNDDAASLSINDVSLAEGNSGNTAFTFDVALSTQSASAVTVNFATANGTAVSGSDYAASSGTLTFAAGETEKTVTVQVTGDALVEANETFFVNLASATGATIADAQGSGTITNDDAADLTPDAFHFNDVTNVNPGTSQTSNAITIRGINVPVPFTVSGGFARLNAGNCNLSSGEVIDGDTLAVCHTAGSFGTRTDTAVTIGGISDTFSSTTRAAVIVPNAFSFGSRTNVERGSVQTSEAVAITGLEAPAMVSVDIGQVSINGGAFGSGGMIEPGQTVQVRHTASASFAGTVTSTVTIGGVAGTFSSTTSAEASAPAVSLDMNDVDFGRGYLIRFREITLNTSETQVVTLTNTGNAPLLISSITTTGDFRHTSTCGSTVPAAGSCTISIVFKPTQVGTRTGETRIVSNAVSSPDLISLNGVGKGLVPAIRTNASSYNFGNVKVGASSADRALVITSSGTGPLEIRSISVSGDYSGSHNCPRLLDAGKSCTLTGRFKPKAKGARPGTITISTSAPGSPTVIPLSGNGT